MTKVKNTKTGSVYPFLDARTPMADSPLLPVKLSIILKGSQFRVGLKLYATNDVFNKAMTGKGTIPKEAKLLKDQIDVYLQKAKDILDQFPNADKKMFSNLFKSETALKVKGTTDMEVLFKQKIDELTEEDRAGSIAFYEQALTTFKRFRKTFYLEDITVEYLKAFRAWWTNQGNSNATAQIHMRSLRHIYNRAIKQPALCILLKGRVDNTNEKFDCHPERFQRQHHDGHHKSRQVDLRSGLLLIQLYLNDQVAKWDKEYLERS